MQEKRMASMRSEAHNTDCIEFMRSLPDKCFSLAVCDPPYGKGNDESLVWGGYDSGRDSTNISLPSGARITAKPTSKRFGGWFRRYDKPLEQTQWRTQGTLLHTDSAEAHGKRDTGGGKSEAPKWDVAPPQEFFDELFRVSRNQIIWGGNYFSLPPTRCFLVWKKHIPETFSMAMCEYAWTSFTGNAKVFEFTSQRGAHSGKFHPTEKPQELYGWIYRNYVNEGDTVFDPMMGSQASRIVAAKMGIDYVGCEIDEYYYAKGCEFFDREVNGINPTAEGSKIIQQSLFDREQE